MKGIPRILLIWTVILLAPAVLAVAAYELYVRAMLYTRIDNHFNGMPLWLQNQTLTPSAADSLVGAKAEVRENGLLRVNTRYDVAMEISGKTRLDFSVRTNNLGLLSDLPVTIARDPRDPEYRVLVYGDSLTGTVTANYQWVDTVEELLNARPELHKAVGGRRFRVYNLGVVAAGFLHFWDYHHKAGAQLDGDLLLVNFTYDDFPRRHTGPRFSNPADMVAEAAESMKRFRGSGIPLLVTQMPIYGEIVPAPVAFPMTRELEQHVPGLSVIDMRPRLPDRYGPSFLKHLYNLPFDHHLSDYGGEIYARAIAGVIAERIAGTHMDFTGTRSAYFNPAQCMPGSAHEAAGPPVRVLVLDGGAATATQVGEIPVPGPGGWRALAGGTRSGGAGTFEVGSRAGMRTLLYRQGNPSSYGSPSLTNMIGRGGDFAGRTIALRFQARSDAPRQFNLTTTRNYGANAKSPVDDQLDQIPFAIGTEWTDITIPISIPPVTAGRITAKGGDHLRVQIAPLEPGAMFSIEMSPVSIHVTGAAWSPEDKSDCAHRPREATTVRRILADPQAVQSLRSHVKKTLGRAKVFSFRPYALDAIAGIDPLIPPLTMQLNGGFVPVPFGSGPKDVAHLNFFCIGRKITMDNSRCFTNQHFFVQ